MVKVNTVRLVADAGAFHKFEMEIVVEKHASTAGADAPEAPNPKLQAPKKLQIRSSTIRSAGASRSQTPFGNEESKCMSSGGWRSTPRDLAARDDSEPLLQQSRDF